LNDTKGSIYLYDNQPDKAVELLEFAVRTVTKDPRFQFHLAAAYFGINKMDEAAKYFREAMQAGLESQVLTQADRKLIADMQGLLKTPISAPITVPNR
jgi:predicted Zn-dependent protease